MSVTSDSSLASASGCAATRSGSRARPRSPRVDQAYPLLRPSGRCFRRRARPLGARGPCARHSAVPVASAELHRVGLRRAFRRADHRRTQHPRRGGRRSFDRRRDRAHRRVATARWATASRALLPFAIAANSVPIIAFAPIMNNWFGILNPLSKMMVVAVLVFFPIMINTLRGLTLVDQGSLELMRSYAASELSIFAKVRVPNALPYIFTALKMSATLSLIGAIVAEYFGGARSVLGQFIITEAAFFRFANAWAAIVIASAASIAFFLIIVAIERVAIPWHSSARIADSS